MADERPDLRKGPSPDAEAARREAEAFQAHLRRAGVEERREAPRRRSYSSPSYSPSRRGSGGGFGEAIGDFFYIVFIGWWAD